MQFCYSLIYFFIKTSTRGQKVNKWSYDMLNVPDEPCVRAFAIMRNPFWNSLYAFEFLNWEKMRPQISDLVVQGYLSYCASLFENCSRAIIGDLANPDLETLIVIPPNQKSYSTELQRTESISLLQIYKKRNFLTFRLANSVENHSCKNHTNYFPWLSFWCNISITLSIQELSSFFYQKQRWIR